MKSKKYPAVQNLKDYLQSLSLEDKNQINKFLDTDPDAIHTLIEWTWDDSFGD